MDGRDHVLRGGPLAHGPDRSLELANVVFSANEQSCLLANALWVNIQHPETVSVHRLPSCLLDNESQRRCLAEQCEAARSVAPVGVIPLVGVRPPPDASKCLRKRTIAKKYG